MILVDSGRQSTFHAVISRLLIWYYFIIRFYVNVTPLMALLNWWLCYKYSEDFRMIRQTKNWEEIRIIQEEENEILSGCEDER